MLPLVHYPDPRLLQKSALLSVDDIKDSLMYPSLIDNMFQVMEKHNGCGLAAVQVGYNLSLIVLNVDGKKYVMFNPIIVGASTRVNPDKEGCLSLPGIFGYVMRNEAITVEYIDVKAQPQTLKASGLLARAIQHEFDHTRGKLIITKMALSDRAKANTILESLECSYVAAQKAAEEKASQPVVVEV